MDLIGRLAISILKWGEHLFFGRVELRLIEIGLADLFGVVGGGQAGSAAENEQVRKGIAAEAIGAMKACSNFAGGVQARDGCGGRFRIDAHSTHDVVASGSD